jgi:hypothetical protein
VVSAQKLRFLDREEKIIYPWTGGPSLLVSLSNENEKEQMIWAVS